MCGIVGFIDQNHDFGDADYVEIIKRMAQALSHRGPDDEGTWVDEGVGIVLGHRRLSIIDRSVAGHQPMVSHCGRYVITYNGEIYNYKKIKMALEKLNYKFMGHSDTETMLASISYWGIEKTLSLVNGMFAFALWDRDRRELVLVRDRMGVKPLYYAMFGGHIIFSSELKAFYHYPAFKGAINNAAIPLYLRYNYIPAPYTIFKNVWKCQAATIRTFRLRQQEIISSEKKYWDINASHASAFNEGDDLNNVLRLLDERLVDAIKIRTIADVPLGAFLSGGIDSSLVVALLQRHTPNPIKTFTVAYKEQDYNEADQALAIANYLGTDHTQAYVTSKDALAVIPKLPFLYDEPFADASQIPTYLISSVARQSVTVALSGDGGDELFGGYNRYFWVPRIWRYAGRFPRWYRSSLAYIMGILSPGILNSIFVGRYRWPNISDKLYKLSRVVQFDTREAIFLDLLSTWKADELILLKEMESLADPVEAGLSRDYENFSEKMMRIDRVNYLPDDILTKLDRASMGVSLEARTPLLDYRLVEFSNQLPTAFKIKNHRGKWILKALLNRYVPRKLFDRPKMGFAVPIDQWLRSDLYDWSADLLSSDRIDRDGVLNKNVILTKWNEHQSGKRNWQYCLWNILMLQSWFDAHHLQMRESSVNRQRYNQSGIYV